VRIFCLQVQIFRFIACNMPPQGKNWQNTQKTRRVKSDCFIWTDDEVELLLKVCKEYKISKTNMSGKKKRDYRAPLHEALSLLPSPPAVRRIILDLERALWTVFILFCILFCFVLRKNEKIYRVANDFAKRSIEFRFDLFV